MWEINLPYRVRCSLPDCGKPVNHVLRDMFDGVSVNFCNRQHYTLGKERWEEKKKMNIRIGVENKEEQIADADQIPD